MQLRFLGTGTSSGIPVLGCVCATCLSADPRDRRFRTAAIIYDGDKKILIDAGPEIRLALLAADVRSLDAILLTHEHFDHVAGMDDFRPFTWTKPLPVYALQRTLDILKRQLPYLFDETPIQIGGGLTQFDLHAILPGQPFIAAGRNFTPLGIMHGRLPIIGYQTGGLAYLTDVKTLPPETLEAVRGIDTLVLSCLRETPHSTHLNLEEALPIIDYLKPKNTYLVHMTHEVNHAEWENTKKLPKGVHLAYDGLVVDIPK